MKSYLQLALITLLLSACIDEFTGEEMVKFLPEGAQKTPLTAERAVLVCALAIFDATPDFAGQTPEWQQLPMRGKVHETGLPMRALHRAEECWSSEVASLLDTSSPWEFERSVSQGQFWSRGGVLIIYNQATNHFVAIDG